MTIQWWISPLPGKSIENEWIRMEIAFVLFVLGFDFIKNESFSLHFIRFRFAHSACQVGVEQQRMKVIRESNGEYDDDECTIFPSFLMNMERKKTWTIMTISRRSSKTNCSWPCVEAGEQRNGYNNCIEIVTAQFHYLFAEGETMWE